MEDDTNRDACLSHANQHYCLQSQADLALKSNVDQQGSAGEKSPITAIQAAHKSTTKLRIAHG
jgi:hypothetical protein